MNTTKELFLTYFKIWFRFDGNLEDFTRFIFDECDEDVFNDIQEYAIEQACKRINSYKLEKFLTKNQTIAIEVFRELARNGSMLFDKEQLHDSETD